MYVCHCRAGTDGRIRAAIEAGVDDPVTLGQQSGAGTRCGGCLPALRALLAEHGLSEDLQCRLAAVHAA